MSLPDFLKRHISADTRYLTLEHPFELENGERLDEVVVAYRTWGDVANARERAILVCHALTGSADVEAWWPNIIGAGRAFDPEHDFIVCANILGSCYGTTGPANLNPATGRRYRVDFPLVSVRDMVEVQRHLLDELGIERLELVTGPSLGGMQALEWAVMYPERVGSVVAIGVGGRHSPWCIGDLYEVQSYLRHQGAKINERFDANTYVTLTHAMHTHDLSRSRGDYESVLANVRQPALVVSVSTDTLYPPQEQAHLADLLPNASYEILDCPHGHDGFLIETESLGQLISRFRASRNAAPVDFPGISAAGR